MKNIVHALLISCILFNCSIHGMELIATASPSPDQEQENMQKPLWLPQETIAHIAGYCQPAEKDVLMKLCKDFYACLHNKELILLANPLTVTLSHKRKKMFEYTRSDDVKKLSIWLSTLTVKDINQQNQDEKTPLYIAADYGHIEIVRLLLAVNGIKMNWSYRYTPLFIASSKGHIEVIKLLLAVNGDDRTPLFIASSKGHIETIKLLLMTNDINVNQTCLYNQTALYAASVHGHTKTVKLLLTVDGIDVNKANTNGWTPLSAASSRGHIEVVKLLLAYKANIHAIITNDSPNNVRIRLQQGDTALDIARKEGHTQIVELLEAELLKETEK